MIIISNQLIASLPLIIIGFTILILLISISWQRNHFFIALSTIIGLVLSLLSLLFVSKVSEIDVMSLLSIDSYSIFYTILVIISSLSTCIFSYTWLNNFLDHKEEFYILVLVSTLGGIVLSSTNNFATLFIGIELLSLPLFGLIGYNFHRKLSLEASVKYTILSAIASSFLLFGIALLYANSGTLSFLLIRKIIISDVIKEPLFLVGFGMLITSLGFKLSLVPFHLWTPDVYQGSPISITSFLSTASKISIFSVIMRLFFYIPIIDSMAIKNSLIIISFMSIIFGNIMALFQKNIKRLLGYSSITHVGYLLISIITSKIHNLSLETSEIYVVSYLISNLGIFGVISLISNDNDMDTDSIDHYRGLFWSDPFLSTVMTIMMLSLAGIPITLGFIGKFYVILLSITTHLWFLIGGIIISSTIGLYYYLKIILSFYYRNSKENNNSKLINFTISNSWSLIAVKIILSITAFLTILLGVFPQPLMNLIKVVHVMI
ncbi:NADH-quinone oxidoreductase subunit NuoN [Candidatus Pantoea edessiphila]|uniref:NADH-quinone oxidoreductase subunit N n=1 Tax=Candidatus Pantoea edessiphila TaxID=2044610 RepID=A0A2P5T0V4_9GAMM|nr:NADH-quinone oxidoreductase subunit NuoN [Candidatus Pantoea edessiphila]PPI88218.1 NADH-quinone oxidoreductase subunit NuoN [Candidatus Pantoea edessiphila]